MNEFIKEVRSRYPDRFIFIDAPPILSSSEARILSDIADVVLLVVPHGRATPPQIESAIEVVGRDKLIVCEGNLLEKRISFHRQRTSVPHIIPQ